MKRHKAKTFFTFKATSWLRLHDDLVPFNPERMLNLVQLQHTNIRCLFFQWERVILRHAFIMKIPWNDSVILSVQAHLRPTQCWFQAGKSENKTMRLFPLRNKSALWNYFRLWKKDGWAEKQSLVNLLLLRHNHPFQHYWESWHYPDDHQNILKIALKLESFLVKNKLLKKLK